MKLSAPRAFVCARVSTLDQERGTSVDNQIEQGWGFHSLYLAPLGVVRGEALKEIDESAYTVPLFQRQEGKRLNALLEPGDHVIFTKFDRAFRNIVDFENVRTAWEPKDITIHVIDMPWLDTGTASGRSAARQQVLNAQTESDVKSERLREMRSFDRKHNKHKPFSTAPAEQVPGLKACKKLCGKHIKLYWEKDPIEFAAYLYFLKLAASGKYGWKEIADMCDEYMHKLHNIPYKKSAFSKRLWRDRVPSCNLYARHQEINDRLAMQYGDQPEFHLPIHPRHNKLLDSRKALLLRRAKRLPSYKLTSRA